MRSLIIWKVDHAVLAAGQQDLVAEGGRLVAQLVGGRQPAVPGERRRPGRRIRQPPQLIITHTASELQCYKTKQGHQKYTYK